MRTLIKFYPVLITLFGLSFNVFSQVAETGQANITAKIIESGNISQTGTAESGGMAIMLIFLTGEPNKTSTTATYYYTGSTGYTYSDAPLVIRNGSVAVKVASFISDPVLAAGPNLIGGVYVSVSPSNITVNYN